MNTITTSEKSVKNSLLNPFPGLRPFTIEESHLFFGREGQSDEVLMKLYDNRFVAVVGPSGSGKSSFIYCGVIPILYGGFLENKSSDWNVVVSRPGASPIDNLAEALAEKEDGYKEASVEDKKIKKTIVSTLLKSNSMGLIEAVMQSKNLANRNTLILIDQFEELFRFRRSEEGYDALNESLAFVNLLMEAVRYTGVPIYVAITMRSDFIGECAFFPELTKAINDSYYMIPQMTREQKRMAIVGPVAVGGGEVTPRLVQRLLNDLGDNPDQLPILQHSLMRTWDYWTRHREADEPLDIHHYEAIGTMSEALSLHANEAYDELSDAQKRICESMFKALTEKGGDANQGIRRPTRLSEIAAIADVREEDIIPIVDKFRESGRSLLTPASNVSLKSDTIIDISHESLMRIWIRLKNWVEDESEAVQMYLRLSEAATMYQIGKAGLWRPPDLQLALNWKEKHKPTLVWAKRHNPAFERTMVFLDYSQKEYETEQKVKEMLQKRTLKRTRLTALILGLFTIVAIAFLVYAMLKKVEADQQRVLAEANFKEAEVQKKKAEENAKLARIEKQNAEKSALKAIESQKRAEKEKERAEAQKLIAEQKTEEALRAKQEAEQQREIAKANEQKAIENEQKAIENEKRAKEQEQAAKAAEKRANNLRLLSVAQSMSVKSLQLFDDPELQAINAQQAFRFHDENGGYEYHTDIYNGLYFAIKNIEGEDFNQLKGHNQKVGAIVADKKGGQYIYSAASDGKILKWNIKDNTSEEIANKPGNIYKTMVLSHDGKYLIAGGAFNHLEIYGVNDKSYKEVKLPAQAWQVATPTKSNAGLAIACSDRKIYFWNNDALSPVATTSQPVNSLAISPDAKSIVAGNDKGQLLLWDTNGGEPKEFFKDANVQMQAVGFSNNNKYLVAGESSGRVLIWDWKKSQKPITSLLGHRSYITEVEFNDTDERLATASHDGTVRIWNVSKLNQEPVLLRDQVDWATSVSFSPDSKKVIVGCRDNVMRVFYTDMEEMSKVLCDKTNANMSDNEWGRYVPDDIDYVPTCEGKAKRPNN